MHAHSETWRPPAGFVRRAVDADGLMGAAPHWGAFWGHAALTPAERGSADRDRERLHAALGRLPRDPLWFGMIHADLHHGNLLADGERLTVIDFDDCAFGWHLYDLAVALVHQQKIASLPGDCRSRSRCAAIRRPPALLATMPWRLPA